jgi:hypothetical protein
MFKTTKPWAGSQLAARAGEKGKSLADPAATWAFPYGCTGSSDPRGAFLFGYRKWQPLLSHAYLLYKNCE